MPRLSDERTFSRTLAGASLIAAPLLLLASAAVGPHPGDDGAARLAQIADGEGRYVASHYLLVAGAWAMVPAAIGLWRVFRGPRVTLGQAGAALVLVGWISTISYFGLAVYELEAARPGLDRAVMGRLADEVDGSAMLLPLVVVTFLAGIAIGSLIVAWSLWRRRVVPPWAAAALVVWTGLDIAADNVAMSVAAFAFLLVGFGSVGVKLLRMPDDEWEALGRTPSPAPPAPSPSAGRGP